MELSKLTIELTDRNRPIVVSYSTAAGYVLVEQMEGFNDAELTDLFRALVTMPEYGIAPQAREILALVSGRFADLRAPRLPGSTRLYRDGSP